MTDASPDQMRDLIERSGRGAASAIDALLALTAERLRRLTRRLLSKEGEVWRQVERLILATKRGWSIGSLYARGRTQAMSASDRAALARSRS
jgi:hypothetical protein